MTVANILQFGSTVTDGRYADLAVVANCQGRTNFHRALGRGNFVVAFGLPGEVNGCFFVIRFQKRGRFLQTDATQGAGGVDIPSSRSVQRLFGVVVRHRVVLLVYGRGGNLFGQLAI